ncbi:efflux RND transporter periplasmic adaptor subunit [Planctomicrobium piriforme]|uniref:Multidrug efflux pump subunit AcrA (Membrane-fusion protein) n=1 Tax=Planctomicrobium piriforme TaxID=1576369 RepID=A0A1I3M1C8_9PLAN|nr:efflux RND transporter periplasmic adaptor subunit [Planctomicrobium piriforme]SFI90814.1 Multidrug efflux pump subunit AcrA (membrane-fusion protein) [Planctomicrobium piriforme]
MTRLILIFVVLVVIASGAGYLLGRGAQPVAAPAAEHNENDGHDHAGHDHGDEHGHEHGSDPNQLVLSDQARQNLGLKVGPVTVGEFWRTIVVPGTIAEQPGHSERRITTAVNGIVTKVYVSPGQTVRPGDPLLDVQTTGELLANAQSSLLKTIQDLELIELELKRIEPLAEQGSIPGTRVLEKKYERQRLETQRLVQVQELLVRGLSADQIKSIMESRVLLRTFTIRVPISGGGEANLETQQAELDRVLPIVHEEIAPAADAHAGEDLAYSVEDLSVFPGKLIQPGDELCGLALHTSLRVIGMAFQKEAELINQVIQEQRPVTAIFESQSGTPLIRENLTIQYADNVVDPDSRLLRFYLPLKNEVIRDVRNAEGITFRAWRFKPGQRVQLRLPAEHWTDKIVLPIEAVVKEGAETYVFRENGKLFERVPVSVVYEDSRSAVLANDGSVFEGDFVAMNEAYQLNLALRKAQGGGVDLHAGHNH